MSVLFRKKVYLALAGAVLLLVTASPLRAQTVALGRPSRDCCQPAPLPCQTPVPSPTQPPTVTPPDGQPAINPLAFEGSDERATARASVAYVPPMLGDLLVPTGGLRTVFFAPRGSTPTAQVFRLPSANHGFKIADDNSPRPQNRVFTNYNYYNDINTRFDGVTQTPVGRVDVHHEVFGFEKTFLNGNASFEMRLPLNTLNVSRSTVPGLGGSSTDVGDLTFVFKGILLENRDTGNLLSGGLAVTVPTGPSNFAGVNNGGPGFFLNPVGAPLFVAPAHDTLLQPWLGYIYNAGDFFVHGFSALDIPTASNDVTLAYQDFGIGYYLFRDRSSDRLLTGVIPTLELHVNTPLNHRGSMNGPLGTPDWVDLTAGTTFELFHRSTLAVGIATPVTGPKPYDLEAIVQFNLRF